MVGSSNGGLPYSDNKVYTFNSASEAKAVLRDGESLRAIGMIFNPGPAFAGAAQVDFIRWDLATAGTLLVSDGSGTAMTLTTVDKGEWVNRLLVQVATSGGGRQLTFKIPDVSIQKGADATIAGAVLTSASALFKTKGARVGDFISLSASPANANIFVILSVDSETQVTLATSPTAGASQTWNHFTYSRTIVSDVLLSNPSIIAWINANIPDVFTAVQGTNVLPANTTGNGLNVSSGSVTAGGLSDLVSSLVLARPLNVQHLYVARACGNDTGLQELDFAGTLIGHINNFATVPAIAYVGGAATKQAVTGSFPAVSYAQSVNSARIVYAYQTVIESTVDGLSTENLGGYYLAARLCGLAAGLLPQTPLTRKPVTIRGIVAPVSEPTLDIAARENLLKNGICHVFAQPGTSTFIVNQGLSTLQKNDTIWDSTTSTSSEISLMRVTDALLYNMRVSADAAFIGGNASIGKAAVENFARSYLESTTGLLITDWRNLVVTQVADQWRIEFGFIPSNPTNYVLIVGTVIG